MRSAICEERFPAQSRGHPSHVLTFEVEICVALAIIFIKSSQSIFSSRTCGASCDVNNCVQLNADLL
jgi:hypothetical protein